MKTLLLVGLFKPRRLPFLAIPLLALLSIAAAAPDSTTVAVNIAAAILAIVSPFLPLAQLHLDGKRMVAISMVVALVIAVGSSLLTGEVKTSDLGGSALDIFAKFGLIWTAQQAVFQYLKDHVPALTDKPLLVAPPATPPVA